MFILRFAFDNHRCFRDEVDLTMVQPRLRTGRPQEGSWEENTTRVAAIYGANGSGKSAVLDALRYLHACVTHSATSWSNRRTLPRAPFALDESSRDRPSSYVLDFVLQDVRHEYGFAVSSERVEEEWLYTFPMGRKRIVFERGAGAGHLNPGRELGAGGSMLNRVTGERELVLAKAAVLQHPLLSEIYENIKSKIDIANFGEFDRQNRLRTVIQDIADGSLALDDLRTMLRVADVGIAGAEVKEEEADPRLMKILRAVFDAHREDDQSDGGDEPLSEDDLERISAEVARSLMFMHIGAKEKTYSLPSSEQSTGTLTWLSLAAPAIKTIREGGLFAVDELDASLHPQLSQIMIQMFRDPSVNTTGAQLIFTTHDTFFMSPISNAPLTPDEIWFVEKGRDGVSDLFRLSDFPTRSDQNLSRRYLQGRYGAVPSVAPSFLAAIARKDESDDSAVRELT